MKSFLVILTSALLCAVLAAAELWTEGEAYQRSNWTGKMIVCRPGGGGASGHRVLQLHTRNQPPEEGYFAEYRISVVEAGNYQLWISSTPMFAGWVSPGTVSVDGGAEIDLSLAKWKSLPFGDRFLGWSDPGAFALTPGSHVVTFRIRKPRRMDNSLYLARLDGFFLTTASVRPPNHYRICPRLQPDYRAEAQAAGSHRQLVYRLECESVLEIIGQVAPQEEVSPAHADEVRRKLAARPLPVPGSADKSIRHRFGLHGMEKPFVVAGEQEKQTEEAFELLARAGVDSLRTAELCWHRLLENPAKKMDFTEIDYQVSFARKYGMNFLFTIGYPPREKTVGGHHLSTFRPEFEPQFRAYLQTVLPRYDRYAQYWEYCNEVDAPHVWWRRATPEQYARDCRIVRQEMAKLGIATPLLGISATYSRTDTHDAAGEGRAFTRKALRAGMAPALDGYSLHYTWPMKQRGFVEFFRNLTPGGASRLLVNSEEAGYTHPSDVIKLFARNFYLYGFDSVYYYVSRDWIEAGNLIYSGLFDVMWRPKLRLLSFAAAADAMKSRDLAALAEPAPGVEAYLLTDPNRASSYAIVMWRAGGAEEHGSRFVKRGKVPAPVRVELPSGTVAKAVDWRLDDVAFDTARPVFTVRPEPVIVYVSKLPDWKRFTPAEWLARYGDRGHTSAEADIPRK